MAIHPVRVSLGKGAEHDYHLTMHLYIGLKLESAANQSNELRVFGPLFLAVMLQVINKEIQIHPCDLACHAIGVVRQPAGTFQLQIY